MSVHEHLVGGGHLMIGNDEATVMLEKISLFFRHVALFFHAIADLLSFPVRKRRSPCN